MFLLSYLPVTQPCQRCFTLFSFTRSGNRRKNKNLFFFYFLFIFDDTVNSGYQKPSWCTESSTKFKIVKTLSDYYCSFSLLFLQKAPSFKGPLSSSLSVSLNITRFMLLVFNFSQCLGEDTQRSKICFLRSSKRLIKYMMSKFSAQCWFFLWVRKNENSQITNLNELSDPFLYIFTILIFKYRMTHNRGICPKHLFCEEISILIHSLSEKKKKKKNFFFCNSNRLMTD